jgi:hypothetical protein
MKLYALFTLHETGWGTRAGIGDRESRANVVVQGTSSRPTQPRQPHPTPLISSPNPASSQTQLEGNSGFVVLESPADPVSAATATAAQEKEAEQTQPFLHPEGVGGTYDVEMGGRKRGQ